MNKEYLKMYCCLRDCPDCNNDNNKKLNSEILLDIIKISDLETTILPSKDEKVNNMQFISQKVLSYAESGKLPILYRYSGADINNIANLLSGTVRLMPISKLNDAMEGFIERTNGDMTDQITKWQDEIYLKCFSPCPYYPLMWAHYGDDYKGICVGYNFNLDMAGQEGEEAKRKILEHLYPVQYSKKRFVSTTVKEALIHPFFYLRKSSDWEYEHEWRLIYNKEEAEKMNSLLKLDFISEIYLGTRIAKHIKELVCRIAQEREIKVYQTKIGAVGYEIVRCGDYE